MDKKKLSIFLKDTVTVQEIAIVLNALGLYTSDELLIEKLKNSDNVELREPDVEEV